MNGLGGNLETFYYAFGSDDVVAIGYLPDNASAAAAFLTMVASGSMNVRTIILITPEEIDEAAQMEVDYRPPRQ